ncbi:MAG: penicillin-binding protein 2 [Burkholderiaceae bacterium]|jgi:penicillin-binding protein 2|nr:penicillin-binding protein 2 [Burkholderiaceae bacterium]
MTELRHPEVELNRFRLRLLAAALVVLVCFGLLGWRLYWLQVLRHEELARQAESNRTAVVPIVPNRGEILDRNGVVLATNYRAYTLEITPDRLTQPLNATIDAINRVVPIPTRSRRRFMRLLKDSHDFDSLPIHTNLTDQEMVRFAAQQYRFPGVQIKARLLRTYPLGETGAHLIGYTGRMNVREKENIEESEAAANYRGTDHIGKEGIERRYESVLHGHTGFDLLETASGGQTVRQLDRQAATPGDTLRLTVDINLQKLAEDLYGERRGALVAIDPRNGEVLALVSKPTFDPNLFIDGIDQENWDQLNTSDDRPLLNRALSGTYPPGSTYKPFMALAALEKRFRTPDQITIDNGSWVFGGRAFRSADGALGPVNLSRAIIRSSDVYFYQLANDMGVNAIHDFMAPLGFGGITGIDLPGEARGVLPSTEWKRLAYRQPGQQKWYPGETISLGIGQGYNNFTMLQMAGALSTLVNQGVRHTPHLVRELFDPLRKTWSPAPQPQPRNLGLRGANMNLVRRAMVGVTEQGTSRASFSSAPYPSGGKTGTAQVVGIAQNSRYDAARLAERHRDHSLYIAFAPADKPTIAVAAVVENAGWGAVAAAPLVRRVLDYWVAGLYPSEEDLQAIQKGRATIPLGTPRQAAEMSLQRVAAAP